MGHYNLPCNLLVSDLKAKNKVYKLEKKQIKTEIPIDLNLAILISREKRRNPER